MFYTYELHNNDDWIGDGLCVHFNGTQIQRVFTDGRSDQTENKTWREQTLNLKHKWEWTNLTIRREQNQQGRCNIWNPLALGK